VNSYKILKENIACADIRKMDQDEMGANKFIPVDVVVRNVSPLGKTQGKGLYVKPGIKTGGECSGAPQTRHKPIGKIFKMKVQAVSKAGIKIERLMEENRKIRNQVKKLISIFQG
jgi:hypothetical protein